MGEDRVWIEILQNPNLSGPAKAFWQVNDRNPLAPWWYIAFSPIILRYEAGLFLIREVIGLLLAISTYIFLFVMTRSRTFALGVACVVAVFLGNGFIDQIYWPMQTALIFSLWSLTLYKLFIDNCLVDYRLYIGAIVTWFVALGTYSIQTGAILAIAFLAFAAPASSVRARIRRTITDILPFSVIFFVFWLEWQTTARNLYTVQPQLRLLFLSMQEALWHFDYHAFLNDVIYVNLSYRLIFVAVAGAVGVFVLRVLNRGSRECAGPLPTLRVLQTALAVGLLMLPVLAVEASGYGIPGEQWRKVYQFTIPFFYLSFAGVVLTWLPPKVARIAWCAATASLAAVAAAVTLGLNHIQVEVTHNEKLLRSGLIRLAQENFNAGHPPPYQFLVQRGADFLWYSSDLLSPTYARTWDFPLAASFRFLPTADTSDPRLSLRFTEEGVENSALDGRSIRDAHIVLVSATKKGIYRLCSIGPESLQAPVIEWRRSTMLRSNIGDCSSASQALP